MLLSSCSPEHVERRAPPLPLVFCFTACILPFLSALSHPGPPAGLVTALLLESLDRHNLYNFIFFWRVHLLGPFRFACVQLYKGNGLHRSVCILPIWRAAVSLVLCIVRKQCTFWLCCLIIITCCELCLLVVPFYASTCVHISALHCCRCRLSPCSRDPACIWSAFIPTVRS